MKSLLQEGSSIMKAIEAAWVKVGKPEEFSIKVLKNEEQRFLGITWKNSVVVSISYDFAHHERRGNNNRNGVRHENKKKVNHEDILEKVMRDTERLQAETDCFGGMTYDKKQEVKHQAQVKKNDVSKKQKKQPEKKEVVAVEKDHVEARAAKQSFKKEDKKPVVDLNEPVGQQDVKLDQDSRERWTEPMVEAVVLFLKDIFKIMDISVPFIYKVENLQLKVLFKESLYQDRDQEYKVYTSLAFLMLQMIKREFKKKCKGYRVVFGLQEQEGQ